MWTVNESNNERCPGCVDAFVSKDEMLLQHEYWYADGPHLIFNEQGEAYKFEAKNEILTVKRRTDLDLSREELARFMEFIETHQIRPREVKPAGPNPILSFLRRLFAG
ncbi:MAG: hypothetical protein NXI12_04120 [Alphaproteobacteria bacterium]|nr:hypothetical protein [Alphaproteobacteria bacterium]